MNQRSFIIAICIVLTLFKLGLLALNLISGFEISDEGAVMLGFSRANGDELHLAYQVILKPLFYLSSLNVFSVRLLTLLTELATAFLLLLAVWRSNLQQASMVNFILLLLYTIAGIGIGLHTNSVYYLHISNHLSYLLIALMLFYRKQDGRKDDILPSLLICAMGIVTGFWWFVKFSSALVALCILLTYFVLQNKRWLKVGCYVLGIFLFVLFYFTFYKSPVVYFQSLQHGLSMINLQGYSSIDILKGYLLFDAPCFAFFFITGIIGFYFARLFTKNFEVTFSVGLVFLCVAIFLSEHSAMLHFFRGYHLKMIHLLLYMFFTLGFNYLNTYGQRGLWLLWLLVFPFVAAVGTAIPLQMSMMSYCLPIVIAIGVAVIEPPLKKWFKAVLTTLLIVCLFVQFVHLQFYNRRLPHGYSGTILQQTEYLEKEGIYVSKEVDVFISGLKSLLNNGGYNAKDNIIALTDMPGVVYLLNGTSPSTHWYFSKNTTRIPEAAARLDCYHLEKIDFTQKNYLLILEQTDTAILACVKGFPANYNYLGKVFSPYHHQFVAAWASKNQ